MFATLRDSRPMPPFLRAYLVCALWSSTGDDGIPLDQDHGLEDLAPEAVARAEEECRSFQEENRKDLALYYAAGFREENAGHDFWLTRNGHGAGFWCRELDALGDRLTDAAGKYLEIDLYVGDDGRIYGTP